MIKMTLVLASAFFAFNALATVESNFVTKEHWICKGSKPGYVSSLKVTVDNLNNTATGSLEDGTMTTESIQLSKSKDGFRLEGDVSGYDNRFYTVELVPNSSDDFSSNSNLTKAKAQAVVVYRGFIDCHGDVSGAEILTCSVQLERSK